MRCRFWDPWQLSCWVCLLRGQRCTCAIFETSIHVVLVICAAVAQYFALMMWACAAVQFAAPCGQSTTQLRQQGKLCIMKCASSSVALCELTARGEDGGLWCHSAAAPLRTVRANVRFVDSRSYMYLGYVHGAANVMLSALPSLSVTACCMLQLCCCFCHCGTQAAACRHVEC
jgi:hypothetical protein